MSGVTWSGLDQLRDDLRRLPADLSSEAGPVVTGSANDAADEIRKAYASHRRSGNLEAGVTVKHADGGQFGAAAIVKSTAKHASLFESGTQARHNALGANRGSMPPGHAFVPPVVRHRRQMYQQLKDLLVRHGFVVSGDV